MFMRVDPRKFPVSSVQIRTQDLGNLLGVEETFQETYRKSS